MLHFHKLFSMTVLALALASAAFALPLAAPSGVENAKIDIAADTFSMVSTNVFAAIGNVVVRHGDVQITADRMEVNRVTGEVSADGNVVIVREGQMATRSEHLLYNYKTGEGLSASLDAQTEGMRVIAKQTVRRPDETFRLRDALVTTCTNEPGHMHWFAHGATADYKPNDYVELEDMTLRFANVPIFYFPWWKRSFSEHYGWRFVPGYESDWGGFILSTYKRQLVDFGGPFHDSLDSETHIDFRTERGIALGEDLLWHSGAKNGSELGHEHAGKVGVYWVNDDKPMDEDFDRELGHDEVEDSRYRVTLRHDSFFADGDYLTVRTSYMSDSYLMPDFYEDEYKSLVQPESFASYTHTGDGWSAGVGVYHRANEFYETVNRMPEVWADVLRTQIGATPFYYESQTVGGLLQREYADYGLDETSPYFSPVRDSYDSLRIDTRHGVFMPKNLFGFLSLVPRAVYRGTYYSSTMDTEEVLDGSNIVERVVNQGGKLRNLFELGAETSFKMYGLYDTDSGRVRHVVEPYINYTLIPEPNVTRDELYQFDSVDKLGKSNFARFGVRQRLQRKVDDDVFSMVDLDAFGIYEFEDDEGDSGLGKIGVDGTFRPMESMRMELEATYDVEESEVDKVDLWATLWNADRWEAAGECYYRPDVCTLFTGSMTFSASEEWKFNVYGRYDAELSRLEEVSAYVQYNLDCISFRFRTSFEPAFTRDDGTERSAKVRFSFYTWLRAFTPERYERKLHDGYW